VQLVPATWLLPPFALHVSSTAELYNLHAGLATCDKGSLSVPHLPMMYVLVKIKRNAMQHVLHWFKSWSSQDGSVHESAYLATGS